MSPSTKRQSREENPVAGESEGRTYTEQEVEALFEERTKGLKANRDEALREAKKAKEALQNYEGVDASEYAKLKAASEEAERKKAEAQGDFKRLEAQLIERHKDETDKFAGREQKVRAALEKRLVQAELTAAIARAKGNPELLLPHAERFVRVKETDNDFVAYVADEQGNPLVSDGQGTPMTFDQLVEQRLMARFPAAFEGTGSSGGGASRPSGGTGGGARSIAANDADAFLANLEGIAKGTVTVS
jgi:hypothetical protein